MQSTILLVLSKHVYEIAEWNLDRMVGICEAFQEWFANPILLRRFIRNSRQQLGQASELVNLNPSYAMKDWNPFDVQDFTDSLISQATLSQNEMQNLSQSGLSQNAVDPSLVSIPPQVY